MKFIGMCIVGVLLGWFIGNLIDNQQDRAGAPANTLCWQRGGVAVRTLTGNHYICVKEILP